MTIDWTISLGNVIAGVSVAVTIGGGLWHLHRCIEKRLGSLDKRLAVVETSVEFLSEFFEKHMERRKR